MKPRIKMRQMPGDVSKQTKAAMMEGKIRGPGAKSFKKTVRMKKRAVLKRRAQKEIKDDT